MADPKTCLVVFGAVRAIAMRRLFPSLFVWHVGAASTGERFDRIIVLLDRVVDDPDDQAWLTEMLPMKLTYGDNRKVEYVDLIDYDRESA